MSYPLTIKSQGINQGVVSFTTVITDTVNQVTTTLPDTVYYKYYFKGKNYRFQYGTDSVNNSCIVNVQGRYSLSILFSNKTYSFDTLAVSIDSLMNFWDTTTVRYMITDEHKSIMGYYCTKGYFFNVSLGDETYNVGDTTSMIAFWFTNQIQGNNLIPGASPSTLNLNGLILGYEIPVTNGIEIITPVSISTEPLDDAIFFPNLTGYINTNSAGNN